jgi:hypothetical protein
MKTWQTLFREGDPAADARLSSPDVERMRRVVVAAAREPRPAAVSWYQPLAMAALVVIMIGVGATVGHRADWEPPPPSSAGVVPDDDGERRQLQFATPGGTRIIWVFNSEFDLDETLP